MRELRNEIAIVAGPVLGNIRAPQSYALRQEGTKVTAADMNDAAARAVI